MTGARGEGYVEVDGERLPILLTNRALAEVEQATGRTVLQIANASETGALGVMIAGALLRAGLEYGRRDARAGGKPYTMTDVWRIMDALGFVVVLPIVIRAFAGVLAFRGSEAEETDDPPV